jgi:Uma2 family endonuclease
MIDNTLYMGVNAPRPHQRVISKLMTALGSLFYKEGKIRYEPFPEMMIDEGKTSPTPDVLLYDNETGLNQVIVEVSSTAAAKKDFEKVIELVRDYEVKEGFVYDYNKRIWRKYQAGIGEVKERPSFCDAIGYDLNDFVK